MGALRAAFPSQMAANALDQLRIARIDAIDVELTGPAGAIGIFRARVDEVSRVLSIALGRRIRAVLIAQAAPEAADAQDSPRESLAANVNDHPLVQAARRAFNAEVARIEPARGPESPP